ncbi:GatB/YqeY domain-containing protein [Thioalkalivibrio sulfidiphilus]|uniref:GatB/YqeY domain-containing protein n=1 Tax=Thioalkalivibrio sulfidiphilus TaxID=1033854 RepID=UPI000368017B|nr:GatB/YqeY domain-containing protein [Thioalkalivibrio sulfidiphilus]
MSTDSPLKARITEDMKSAMRAGDKSRLGTIRLMLAAVKQVEVDTRASLDDTQVLAVLDKMVKQRRESIEQYRGAGRDDLADVEVRELEVIQSYLPEPLSEGEITAMIDAAISETGASSVRDMGQVMGLIKPRIQGRADMAAVSAQVKARLA